MVGPDEPAGNPRISRLSCLTNNQFKFLADQFALSAQSGSERQLAKLRDGLPGLETELEGTQMRLE